MSSHFADRLLERCSKKGAAVCVGIDPVWGRLPESVRKAGPMQRAGGVKAAAAAIGRYVREVLEAIAPHVPCVKFQSACFERYLWPGVEVYYRSIQAARDMGLIVIADAKRGDIGVSAAHYAAGCLGDPEYTDLDLSAGPDAVTVNPYLGADSLTPFMEVAQKNGKGVFALVRTSNPGSDALQGLEVLGGATVAGAVAGIVAQVGAEERFVGESGYSLLGAVVGATKPQDAVALREAMPQQVFLVPGFGAQGGTADDVRACFKEDGTGALVTASRSVIFAYEGKDDPNWQAAVEAAAIDLRDQIGRAVAAGA